MTATNTTQGLSISALEDVYDTLAEAIDRAGRGQERGQAALRDL
jgi:hypothetical protein